MGLLDENDYYVLYEINEIKQVLPSIYDKNFITDVKEILFNKLKFEFNTDIIKRISNKKFTQKDFDEISKKSFTKIKNIQINSIKDYDTFDINSVKYLYKLNKNDFGLISDDDKNIYLIKIKNISESYILKNSEDFSVYNELTKNKIKTNIFSAYDILLNNKYEIKVNEKTVERVKNYFR